MQALCRSSSRFFREEEHNIADSNSDDSFSDDETPSSGLSSSDDKRTFCRKCSCICVVIPSSEPEVRTSVDFNQFYIGCAQVNARLLDKAASSLGAKLTGKFRLCTGCSQVKDIRQLMRKEVTFRAFRRLEHVFADVIYSKSVCIYLSPEIEESGSESSRPFPD